MVGLEPINKIMNVYYEFLDSCIDKEFSNFGFMIPSKYGVRLNILEGDPVAPFVPGRLALSANRIWIEDEAGVHFIKHREDVDPEVDLKEFMFVKLKAVNLNI